VNTIQPQMPNVWNGPVQRINVALEALLVLVILKVVLPS
jgi:hypothetical protein